MKAVQGFKLRPLGPDFILVPAKVNSSSMISMNATAAYLWREICNLDSFSVEDLAALLVKEYEIDDDLALRDSAAIAAKWVEAGIVQE